MVPALNAARLSATARRRSPAGTASAASAAVPVNAEHAIRPRRCPYRSPNQPPVKFPSSRPAPSPPVSSPARSSGRCRGPVRYRNRNRKRNEPTALTNRPAASTQTTRGTPRIDPPSQSPLGTDYRLAGVGTRTRTVDVTCAIAQALDVVGDWWSLLVLRDVARGLHRFEELRRAVGVPQGAHRA